MTRWVGKPGVMGWASLNPIAPLIAASLGPMKHRFRRHPSRPTSFGPSHPDISYYFLTVLLRVLKVVAATPAFTATCSVPFGSISLPSLIHIAACRLDGR